MPDPEANERFLGRSGSFMGGQDRMDYEWVVRHTDTESGALAIVVEESDETKTVDMGDEEKTLHRLGYSNVDQVGADSWVITVTYGPEELKKSEAGTVRVTYDTAGGTAKVFQAIETVEVYAADGGTEPDFFNTINNDGENIEGVDVPTPVFKLTVRVTFEADDLPEPGDVFSLTGKTNEAEFSVRDTVKDRTYTFNSGEALFLGGTESEATPDGLVDVTYAFDCLPSVENITVGSISGIDKKGWEYLWVRYEKKEEGTGASKILVNRPKFVVVQKVAYEGDFDVLQIPAA